MPDIPDDVLEATSEQYAEQLAEDIGMKCIGIVYTKRNDGSSGSFYPIPKDGVIPEFWEKVYVFA